MYAPLVDAAHSLKPPVPASATLWTATLVGRVRHYRHHPPADTCAAGTPLQLGMATDKVFSVFDPTSKQIVASDCSGMVAGLGPGGAIVLVNSADAAAVEWTQVAR